MKTGLLRIKQEYIGLIACSVITSRVFTQNKQEGRNGRWHEAFATYSEAVTPQRGDFKDA